MHDPAPSNTAFHIIIADDDDAIRAVLTQLLQQHGYEVTATGSAASLWRMVADGKGDIVLTDVIMPDGNGLELLPRMKALRPNLPIIAMSAQSTLITAIKANQLGAFDYLPKPFDLNELAAKIAMACTHVENIRNPAQAKGGIAANSSIIAADIPKPSPQSEIEKDTGLIGKSLAMQEVYRRIARLSATDLSVLIIGESGAGKELVARSLHQYSKRQTASFIAVNMAAIPRELIESELFGHEKGAFTGAQNRAIGRFEQAQGGDLFLDEIGDMPLEAQTRLLRVLQDGSFFRVGGRQLIKTNVRIIAATHRDLPRLVEAGSFREDLYYRLAVAPVQVPPLRARREDIADLARYFLKDKQLTQGAVQLLEAHDWPGNVRELMNLMLRISALYPEQWIEADAIRQELAENPLMPRHQPAINPQPHQAESAIHDPQHQLDQDFSDKVEMAVDEFFKRNGHGEYDGALYRHFSEMVDQAIIKHSLRATQGNRMKAAAMLGINRNTLRSKSK
ncbi:MAG: nitrogen regulation protein NR(I), partial [Alphaproteobacteria bacterium]